MKKKTAITGAVLLVITGILLVSTFLFSGLGDEALPEDLKFEVHENENSKIQKAETLTKHYIKSDLSGVAEENVIENWEGTAQLELKRNICTSPTRCEAEFEMTGEKDLVILKESISLSQETLAGELQELKLYEKLCEEVEVYNNANTCTSIVNTIGNETTVTQECEKTTPKLIRTETQCSLVTPQGFNTKTAEKRTYVIKGKVKPNTLTDWKINVAGFEPSWAWWSSDWTKRKQVNITGGASNLSNFTTYLEVIYDSDMQAGFDDLRFINGSCTDNTAASDELTYEFDSISNSSLAGVWVRFPTLHGGQNEICMYYGKSDASRGDDPIGAWDSDYILVAHFDNSSYNGIILNSVGNDGSFAGTPDWVENSSCSFGSCLWFDGAAEAVEFDNSDNSLDANNVTIEAFKKGQIGGADAWALVVVRSHSACAEPYVNYAMRRYAAGGAWVGTFNIGGDDKHSGQLSQLSVEDRYMAARDDAITQGIKVENTSGTNGTIGGVVAFTGSVNVTVGGIGSVGCSGQDWRGIVDEVRISKTVRSNAWLDRTNQNRDPGMRLVGGEINDFIVVTGVLPEVNATYAVSNVTFNCTASSAADVDTLELFIDNVWNYSKIHGTSNNVSFQKGIVMATATHNYSCRGNSSGIVVASSNTSFLVDPSAPVITITKPASTNNLLLLDRNITLEWSITNQSALSSCWYRFEAVNNSFDCGVTSANLTNLIAAVANYNVTVHANTSVGVEGVKSNNFSIVAYSEVLLFNTTSSETASETFNYNVTADGGASISANLFFDGTSYSSTNNGNNTHGEFTRSLVMPTGSPGVKNFYWNLIYGAETFKTQTKSQNLTNTVLCECFEVGCNGSPYLNFTFKDEGTYSLLNGSIASTSWTFFITGSGGGTTESFYYSQSTERPSFAFCFEPSDELYTVDYVTQYEKTGYVQRRAGLTSLALTNSTTETVLYLLNNSLGSYVTIQAQNPYGTPLTGVDIKANKLINNTLTLIEQDISGDDGGVTFWLNTNDDHTFSLTKSSYSSVTSSFRPTNSLYIIVMNPSGSNGSFQSDIEGIDYSFRPSYGQVEKNTNYTFRLNVTSYRSLYDDLPELTNCTLRLYLQNESTLQTVGGCTSGGDNISFTQNTGDYSEMFVAVGFAFGGNTIWVDTDGRLYTADFDIKERGTLKSFFTYFKDDEALGKETRRQQFSRLTLFFFLLTICIGLLSMKTGWDLATGGGGFFVVAIATFMASYGGFLYINATGLWFINQYLLGILAIFISIGYTISLMR